MEYKDYSLKTILHMMMTLLNSLLIYGPTAYNSRKDIRSEYKFLVELFHVMQEI